MKVLAEALHRGGGKIAQFNHPDLGGMGQWTSGGMTMIGDMFNTPLRDRVAALSAELARLLNESSRESESFRQSPPNEQKNWWGADLDHFGAAGSQNNMRYAYFPSSRRLAIQNGDEVMIYDTGEHQIHGVSQQQSSNTSLAFVSQLGVVPMKELRLVDKRSSSKS